MFHLGENLTINNTIYFSSFVLHNWSHWRERQIFFSFTANLLWLYLPCRQTIVSVAVHRWLESVWMGSFKIPPACWLQSRAPATQASAHSMDLPGGRKELNEQAFPPCYPPQKPTSLSKPIWMQFLSYLFHTDQLTPEMQKSWFLWHQSLRDLGTPFT